MAKPRRSQLSLFDSKEPAKDRPMAKVVSFAKARAQDDARQSSQLDSRIIARAAHLLPGFRGDKSGA